MLPLKKALSELLSIFYLIFFTESQKIKIQLIKENKELKKNIRESQKRLQEYRRLSFSD